MDQKLKNKIEDIIMSAKVTGISEPPITKAPRKANALSTVIRTKEDAERFMLELDALYEYSKKHK